MGPPVPCSLASGFYFAASRISSPAVLFCARNSFSTFVSCSWYPAALPLRSTRARIAIPVLVEYQYGALRRVKPRLHWDNVRIHLCVAVADPQCCAGCSISVH